jgi:HEPN domain-containing protein
MDEEQRYEVCKWLIKSQRDLGSAQLLINDKEPYLDVGVYHCQQAAEKALKAYLVYQNVVFEKTHNLVLLLERCTLSESSFEQWKRTAQILTPYATEFRYPGEIVEPELEEAIQALEMAAELIEFVRSVLPNEVLG